MFPRVYKTQPLGPSVCLCPVFTWWQKDESTVFNAVYCKCERMYWTHLTGSVSLDESHVCLQPSHPVVTSRCCRIWPLPLFLPRSHSVCSLGANRTVFSPFPNTAVSQELGSTCSFWREPFVRRSLQDSLSHLFQRSAQVMCSVSSSPVTLSAALPSNSFSFTLLCYLPYSYLTDFKFVSWFIGYHPPTRL